jgi:carboxyl-terminal processing protease
MKKGILKYLILGSLLFAVPQINAAESAQDKTYDQLKLMVDVLGLIQENYVVEKNTKDLITGAIKGMIKTLDPFSQFMEPEIYKDMKTETEGEFGGLGIRIGLKDDILTVTTPLPGTPAYRIGILPEDRIVKIEGVTTRGLSLDDAVQKLRGKPGTKVTISIFREGFKEPKDYTIMREIIKIETIRKRMLDKDIAYIQLTEFNAKSQEDLHAALVDMKAKGMKSLVFDLRNNPGGLLDIAIGVCKEFVGDGNLVVYTQGRDPASRRDYFSYGKAPFADLPITVLVNRGSASASEIVSGCVQDLKRGLIIGTTTFGKGSVQSVFPLNDGYALRLTTAKYYTPLGRSIHRDEGSDKGGIIPDIGIDVPRETEAKLYMQAEEVFAPGTEPKSIVKEESRVKDEVLDTAVELLKARDIFTQGPIKVLTPTPIQHPTQAQQQPQQPAGNQVPIKK